MAEHCFSIELAAILCLQPPAVELHNSGLTSRVPLSQALRMTNSVPCKFNSDASKPVSSRDRAFDRLGGLRRLAC
jgi:hypothetical protein